MTSWLLVATPSWRVHICPRIFFEKGRMYVMTDRWAVYRKTAVVWSFLEMVGATRVLHSPEEKYAESVIQSATTCHHVSLVKYLLSHQLWVQVGNGKNTKEKEKKKEAEWACPESELPLRFRSLNSSSRDLLPWRRPTRAIAVGTAPLKDRLQAAATARKPFHAMRNTMGIDPFFAALFSSAGDAEAT